MNQDEIIEMARQAGFEEISKHEWAGYTNSLETFAELVAQKEREENVKLLMRLADSYEHADKQGSADDIYKIVDYIREKGKA